MEIIVTIPDEIVEEMQESLKDQHSPYHPYFYEIGRCVWIGLSEGWPRVHVRKDEKP